MKNIIKCLFAFVLVLSLNACSSPEERATDIVTDSTTMTNPGMPPGAPNTFSDSSAASGDSVNNGNVETFRHTPIDTITNQDSVKP